jgi:hypothetical protein
LYGRRAALFKLLQKAELGSVGRSYSEKEKSRLGKEYKSDQCFPTMKLVPFEAVTFLSLQVPKQGWAAVKGLLHWTGGHQSDDF